MKAKRKKTRLSPVLLPSVLVLAAVLFGLLLPGLVARVQDRSIDRSAEKFNTSALSLRLMDNSFIVSRLALILEEHDEFTLKNGKFMTQTQAEQTLPAMLDIVQHAGLDSAPMQYYVLEAARPYLLVSAGESAETCIFWDVSAKASYGGAEYEFEYVIDDETGIPIAMGMNRRSADGEKPEEQPTTVDRATRGMAATQALARVLPDCLPLENVSYTAQSTAMENFFCVAIESDGEYIYSMPICVNDNSWSVNDSPYHYSVLSLLG